MDMKMIKDKILNRQIPNLAEWIVLIFATGIILYLTILVYLFQFNSENSVPQQANFFVQILITAGIVGVCWLLGRWLNPYSKLCRWISVVAYVLAILFIGTISFRYVSQTLLNPISDGKSCFDITLRFHQSEFGAVVPEGSYLSLWPYQTGLIFIQEKLMRVFQRTDPLFFQQINCVYLLLLVSAGYGMVCMNTKKIEGRLLYLLLMATNFPLFFNLGCVYGDLPGWTWTMCSLLSFMVMHKTEKKWVKICAAIGLLGSTLLACTYKGNCLIYLIAMVLVGGVLQVRKFRPAIAGVLVVTVIVSIFATGFTQKYYENYAGNVCGKGMPAIAWIAMGLQYNGEEAIPGGWNGFHSDAFISSGYDYDETVRISKQSIEQSVQEFVENPVFALNFFYNKIMKQWANETHGVFWGLNSSYDTTRNSESDWVKVLETKQYKQWIAFMDVQESIVYAILLAYCAVLIYVKRTKKALGFYSLLPVVTFIGGFLFSLIWEAQTRAVMCYPIFLLPIAIAFVCEAWPDRIVDERCS